MSATELYAFTPATTLTVSGVRVGCEDVDGDGRSDLIAASGPGDLPVVEGRDATSLQPLAREFALDGTFRGGTWV